jgi:hypothetical protein
MITCITVVASIVAVAAAVRSTWSPCGVSMLSTITPFGERAKGNRYRSTVIWFIIGATSGGVMLGGGTALLAIGIHSLHASPTTVGALALGAALVAAGSDVGVRGMTLPIHRRQVNERWLDRYRPWVYGAGFGWQIGTGVVTYVTTAAVYLVIVLGALTGRPLVALALGTGFGILRGVAVLLTRHLSSPSDLRAFHRRFVDAGPAVGRAVVAVEVAAAAVLALVLHSPLGAAMVGAAVVVATLSLVHAKRHGRVMASTCSVPTGQTLPTTPGPARGLIASKVSDGAS